LQHGLLLGYYGFARLAESEDAGFDGAGAVEAPVVCGDGLGELPLEDADGGEGFDDGLAVFLEGIVLIGGAKMDLAGESVFVGVDTGALLARVSFWPGCAGRFFGKFGVVSGDGLGRCLL
jgi:hypothetical protein